MIKRADVFKVVEEAGGEITATEISEKLNARKAGIFMKLRKLIDGGKVVKVKPGVFKLAEKKEEPAEETEA